MKELKPMFLKKSFAKQEHLFLKDIFLLHYIYILKLCFGV